MVSLCVFFFCLYVANEKNIKVTIYLEIFLFYLQIDEIIVLGTNPSVEFLKYNI
jgi:hypothetical protein